MKSSITLLFLTVACLLFSPKLTLQAQKIGYVDSQYILNNVPEYQDAKDELNRQSKEWQKEVEDLEKDLTKMEKAYEAEKILMTVDMKKAKKREIGDKEKEIESLRREKFGIEGELFKKRQELIKPIQDKVYTAIKEVTNQGGYVIFFDKASKPTNILYVNEKYNKSDAVLKKMGYKPGGD